MTDTEIPYELQIFQQDIGVIDVMPIKIEKETLNYDIWLPSKTDKEPPF